MHPAFIQWLELQHKLPIDVVLSNTTNVIIEYPQIGAGSKLLINNGWCCNWALLCNLALPGSKLCSAYEYQDNTTTLFSIHAFIKYNDKFIDCDSITTNIFELPTIANHKSILGFKDQSIPEFITTWMCIGKYPKYLATICQDLGISYTQK